MSGNNTTRGRFAWSAILVRVFMMGVVLAAFTACAEVGAPRIDVAHVDVRPEPLALRPGDTLRLSATARSKDGVVLTGRATTWESEDTALATVDANGLVTARRVGSVLLFARVEGKIGSTRASVYEPLPEPVASVQIFPPQPTVTVSEWVELTAVALDANGQQLSGRAATWTSDNHAIALVDPAGLVLGVAAGSAIITATIEGRSAQTIVNVIPPAAPLPVITALSPDSMAATHAQVTITVTGTGFTAQSAVFMKGTGHSVQYVSPTEVRFIIWPGELAASGTYPVRVFNPGVNGGFSNTLNFKVAGVTRVELSGPNYLWVGENGSMQAVGRDWEENSYPQEPVTWTTSNAAVVAVDTDGRLRALSPGYANVTATIAGKSEFTSVDVIATPAHDLLYESEGVSGTIPELWLVSPGPNAVHRRVLPALTYARTPAPSADGSKIAYSGADGEIYVVNRDGTGIRRVTSNGMHKDEPAWSPDGTRIVFSTEYDIGIVNADGTGQRLLTFPRDNPAPVIHERPTWTPDGSRIVYAYAPLTYPASSWQLLSMRPDGTDVRRVTSGAHSDTEAAFAPNGRIAVRRKWSDPGLGEQITILDANGGDLAFINYPGPGRKPTWSPDGAWLAFIRRDELGGYKELIVMWPGDYRQKLIAPAARNPVWIRRQ